MTDGEALLAAILADPADDTKRLVYADWLEENGQPERAEFIRVQCELARELEPELKTIGPLVFPDYADQLGGRCARCMRLKKTCRYHELERRERELWAKSYQEQWFDVGYPPGAAGRICHEPCEITFTHKRGDQTDVKLAVGRGFVSALTLSWETWRIGAELILATHPVEKVRLTTGPGSEQGIRIWEYQRQATIDLLNERWPGIEFELPAARRGMERATLTDEGRRQRLVEARIEVRRNVALGRMTEEEGRRAIAHLEAEVPVA